MDLRARLGRLAQRVAARAGLTFAETADNAFRLTDYTVLRRLSGPAAPVLKQLAELTGRKVAGPGTSWPARSTCTSCSMESSAAVKPMVCTPYWLDGAVIRRGTAG